MPAIFRVVSMLLALTLWPNEPRLETGAPRAIGGRIERPTGTQAAAAAEIIRDLSRLPPRAA